MGLLELPQELRDLIVNYVIIKESNHITMLPSFGSGQHEISAGPPSICAVNRRLRAELLPRYYGENVFSAQLDNESDLLIAQYWLSAIGDESVRHLQRLSFSGWARIPFGHMSARFWIKAVFNLKDGSLDIGDISKFYNTCTDAYPLQNITQEIRSAYLEMFNARQGSPFDADSIGRLMQEFSSVCTGY